MYGKIWFYAAKKDRLEKVKMQPVTCLAQDCKSLSRVTLQTREALTEVLRYREVCFTHLSHCCRSTSLLGTCWLILLESTWVILHVNILLLTVALKLVYNLTFGSCSQDIPVPSLEGVPRAEAND